MRREDPERRTVAESCPRGWNADTCSIIAGFCGDRDLGRLRTVNVTFWRWFGYNACWAHLCRSLVGPYNLPRATPYITQRAFHWCRVLDLRASWHDQRDEAAVVLRRYQREHARLRDHRVCDTSVRRHCIAKRRIEQALSRIEWPDVHLSKRQHTAVCALIERELAVLKQLKTVQAAHNRRLYTLATRVLPAARVRLNTAVEQCRKTDVFQQFLTTLPFYELPRALIGDPLVPGVPHAPPP